MTRRTTKTVLDQDTRSDHLNLNFLNELRGKISFQKTNKKLSFQINNTKNRHPVLYLDTNVMIDIHKNRNVSSAMLIKMIDDKKWNCFTSAFAFMEMIDIEQEDEFVRFSRGKGTDYSKICRERYSRTMPLSNLQDAETKFKNFFEKYPFIRLVSMNSEGWDLALHITSSSSIFAPDAIHLATAWMSDCDLLITNDAHFVKESAKMLTQEGASDCFIVCNADDAVKKMNDVGFKV